MLRSSRCPHCRTKLQDGLRIHPECVDAWYAANMEKLRAKAKKVDRAETRKKLEKFKKISDYIREAQKEFNAFIRLRDADKPCICCGEPLGAGEVGGAFDCGHYRSRGSAPHLRFNEWNAHAQRKYCNRHGAGRAVDYRIGLIARIGLEAVEALESDNRVHKWTAQELREIRETYRAKRKELEKSRD